MCLLFLFKHLNNRKMKKFTSTLAVLLLLFVTISCSPTTDINNEETEQSLIDPEKICPPNDRNCNGIPDNNE